MVGVASLHDNLTQIEDVATELTLIRACADVCKIVHFCRAKGQEIDGAALKKYDETLQLVVE